MHFKGIKTSYLVLNYRDILSWEMNFLTDLIHFSILIDKKEHTIKLRFDDIHVFNDIFMKHINNKVDDIEFAKKFDPQPFHVDIEKAKDSLFGNLCASGWHTCSLYMRMLYDGLLINLASLGSPGMNEIRWIKNIK